ncbi:hypothetical protein LGV61_13265 [Desulfurispirillum indicum]|uniref:rhodanese-like domain-containing protein n=1 Tax=Desulfurispirillum indicum TaxID=936456 RepID=UPI001CFB52ED|nr:rhodanese-like domain-containing protein [Desulfurispirillum indicum]UCZ56679.1 hypothetical protein LGV61_13265 [Desulfurispirillum indicum]
MNFLKSKLIPFAALLFLAFVTVGCGHAVKAPVANSPEDLVANRTAMLAEARAAVPQITIEDLKKMIEAGEEFTLVDARDPDEWGVGLVDYKKVVTISRGKMEFVAPNRFAVNERLIVICKTGARSALTAKALHDLGYKNVTNVTTGMDAWMAAGYPVK